uniref:Uncharacterized protein n=1 Tax=Cajanus cajan TaxID=3821 RepID=A0A151TY05_CAJCA|nr:hypothetical protein KK1_011206 [Cajanus cajan]
MRGDDGGVVPEAVVAAEDLDGENVAVVVELLQPLGAGGGREARFNVDLSDAADADVSLLEHAAADEGLVLLRLVEPSKQRPNLQRN